VTAKEKGADKGDLSERRRRKLAVGVLKQAARDLRRFRGATSNAGRELYLGAYRWLTANEFTWPFSFLKVCQTQSFAPEMIRAELISNLSLGTLRNWRRRLASAVML
jgi:hypothetical protein